jgi:hypothetical protein
MGFDIYSRAAFAFLLMTTLCPAFMTRASNKSKRKQEERMGSELQSNAWVLNVRRTPFMLSMKGRQRDHHDQVRRIINSPFLDCANDA